MINLEITIPVLNEEKTLRFQVIKVITYLESINIDTFDITLSIADNGSTDNTRDIAEELEKEYPKKIRLVKVSKKGVGLALKTSWESSNADIVGYMDLDLATDINHIRQVVEIFSTNNSVDIVYGSRLHKDSEVIGRSVKREITSRIFNWIIKTYLAVGFSDGMCGFKFLKRSIFTELIHNGASSDGWFFCTELLVVSEKMKKSLVELPVKWTDDEESKVKIIPLAIEYLKAMRELKHHE